jgi:hypothetical protein
MGKGNKSVSHIHPIHKHMKGFQSRELTDMPIMHDEKGEGRGGHEGGPSPAKLHGSMKGDQSATHLDYANYKGTDKGYHGHTGSSHGDQSATHLDYLKSGAKNLGSPAKQYSESIHQGKGWKHKVYGAKED